MELLGYLASVLIGLSLGLIGGGGSILTVPVLVYLFAIDPVKAGSYSLFIVGLTSAIGSYNYFKNKLVSLKTALIFGSSSILAVLTARAFIVPSIPAEINFGNLFTLTKGSFLMLAFALIMLLASFRMIKPSHTDSKPRQFNAPMLAIQGFLIGLLTGLLGVGGGFLIIPALVLLSGLPMKEAVGTSLAIIAANSLIGFLGDDLNHTTDWFFLLKITTFAVAGIGIGTRLSKNTDGNKLKPIFGWFVLSMSCCIIIKETLFN